MLEQIEAVQRMQDYIEQHLDQDITPADLSRVSLFSPWYSRRLFIKQLGLSPADYIRKLRLSRSALRLRDEPCRIIEIAFDLGFKSVDGYQRAFQREFGCNPSEYAAHPIPIYLFTPYGVKFRHIERRMHMLDSKNIFIQVIDKPARKVIVKRGIHANDYWSYCEEVGCDIWGLLQSIKSISGEPICLWLPERYQLPQTSQYVQGAEVPLEYDDVIPNGLDIIELPASKYLMFQGEPFNEEDYCEAIELVQSAIKKYDPAFINYQWDLENPKIQLEPIGTRGYIELVPIK